MPVELSEILSRFVLQKNWYRHSDNRVKYAAFMPNPKNGETSVFRTSGISDVEIWQIGEHEVAMKRDKPISGRADIKASVVISKNLRILPCEPPERHANIIAWPDEKSEQK
ncbi:hypothetical protein MNBD_NITROSPIRAE03-85, partial [hydrothermal vent metagenome]